VDGDGLDDLLIGAGGNDQAGDFAGKVYLVYGSTIAAGGSSSLAQADVALLGSAGDDAPGALASAGDVDGDGLDDILIGVPIPGDWGSSPGVTYLFFGASLPASGTLSLSAADAVIIGEVNGDGSGYAVASAGDVDGDGLDDILIGAPYHYLGGGMVGKAYLMFGSTIASGGTFWLSGADANFLEVTGWPDHTGKAVAGVGDVDGDGLDDVLISSPDNLNSTVTYGTAYLFFGSTIASGGSFALTGADAAMEGAGGYQSFGDPVASAGDVDGDGLADVVMSGSSGYLMFGATLVAGGTFVPADADASFPGGSGQMTSAGDVDGDGLDDVLVGATYAANGRGRAYLVLGATIGAGGVFDVELADAIFTGVETGDNAGSSLATVGDINGDSLSDLAIGAGGVDGYTGRTYVLLSAL
jgi:hypothetical protein